MVFAGYSGFPHYLQLASHELATTGINVTKNEIPNPNALGDCDLFFNPSNAEATFVQSTRMQRSLKII